MIPVLLGIGAVLAAVHFTRKDPNVLRRPKSATNTAKAKKKAKAVSVHKKLMKTEFQPKKLEKAAQVFGAEGFSKMSRDLLYKAQQVREQAAAIPDLVQRARAGDQNALGMIAAVREQSDQGNQRAGVTCTLLERYCVRNPPPEQPGDNMIATGEVEPDAGCDA